MLDQVTKSAPPPSATEMSAIATWSAGSIEHIPPGFDEGIALNDEEKPRLVADLGNNSALMLRNHGLLTTGATIADAFLMMYVFETACQIQILAQSGGGELIEVPQPIVEGMLAQAEQVTRGLGGQLVWPGLLRKLERMDPSFRD